MNRRNASTLILFAMLVIALVALQCPRFDCGSCVGDGVVAKQVSPVWAPTAAVVVVPIPVPPLNVLRAASDVVVSAVPPDLHERSSRLLI